MRSPASNGMRRNWRIPKPIAASARRMTNHIVKSYAQQRQAARARRQNAAAVTYPALNRTRVSAREVHPTDRLLVRALAFLVRSALTPVHTRDRHRPIAPSLHTLVLDTNASLSSFAV